MVLQNVIDIHSHCIPSNLVKLLKDENNPFGAQIVRKPTGQEMVKIGASVFPLSPAAYDVQTKLGVMDTRGINCSVLSLSPRLFGYGLSPRETVTVAKRANDGIAQFVSHNPQRMLAMATVPLNSVDSAIDELERAVVDLGMKGVQIGAHMEDRNLDDPVFDPFFEAAEELGVFVLVHPYARSNQKGLERYYLENLIGMLVDTSICMASLIFGGIMDRYPQLKICFSHGGAMIPYQYGRLAKGYNVRNEIQGVCEKDPSWYLDKFYYDTITHNSSALKYLIDTVGAQRILLGSDDPFDMGDSTPVNTVINVPQIRKIDCERILNRNAAKIFTIF